MKIYYVFFCPWRGNVRWFSFSGVFGYFHFFFGFAVPDVVQVLLERPKDEPVKAKVESAVSKDELAHDYDEPAKVKVRPAMDFVDPERHSAWWKSKKSRKLLSSHTMRPLLTSRSCRIIMDGISGN